MIVGVDVVGVGLKGQIELVYDFDNDLLIVVGIVGDIVYSVLDGVGKVFVVLFGYGGEVVLLIIQLIGVDLVLEYQVLVV